MRTWTKFQVGSSCESTNKAINVTLGLETSLRVKYLEKKIEAQVRIIQVKRMAMLNTLQTEESMGRV